MRPFLNSFSDINQPQLHPGSRSFKCCTSLFGGMALAVAGTCGLSQPVSAEIVDLESDSSSIEMVKVTGFEVI